MTANKQVYGFGILIAVAVNVFSWNLPFFWDTILTSTITQHFYEHGFHGFITPAQFDAGHPPLFYVYVTCFYLLFGKTLLAAHLSMLPFTVLGVVSFISLMQHSSFSKAQQIMGVVLFFSIPAVITQNTMVSYDAVLLSLYLAALAAYFKNNKIVLVLMVFGMLGITLRGLFCVVSLSATIFFIENRQFKAWFRWNVLFAPVIVIVFVWYVYHYTQTGWFFATKAEGWTEQRGLADTMGLLKNGFSIARCFFDLGILILTSLGLFYVVQKRKADMYTLLWLIPAMIFSVSFLPFTNPINHRYFLIVYVLMLFPVIRFLSERKIIYTFFTLLILLLGHFQIYPVPISNGWDCTLVNMNYNKDIKIIHKSITGKLHLDRTKIGTVFPMNASSYQTEMLDDTTRMININGKSIYTIEFILFSNIGNDFSDEQIKELRNWLPVIVDKNCPIEIILYRNPKFNI